MLGFPVDAIDRRPAISGVVIGRIAALERHPNADRLQVAQVDVGGEQPLTIATAATNVAAGQTIAVATIGAQLPELVIAPRTMRGIASQGMMISAEELALPAEWFEDGIMQMDESLALGSDVVEVFGLDTAVLEVEITSKPPRRDVGARARARAGRVVRRTVARPVVRKPRQRPRTARRGAARLDRIRRLPPLRRAAFRRRAGRHGAGVGARSAGACRTAPDQQPRRRLELRDARDRSAPALLRCGGGGRFAADRSRARAKASV